MTQEMFENRMPNGWTVEEWKLDGNDDSFWYLNHYGDACILVKIINNVTGHAEGLQTMKDNPTYDSISVGLEVTLDRMMNYAT